MNTAKITLSVLLVMILLTSLFTITQGQQGILLRLGRLVDDPKTNNVKILNPGLHFKIPFI